MIYLDVGDYLAIGEAVLGVPAQELFHASKDGSLASALMAPRQAFGGVDMYPSLTMKAAVLCSRLVRNHPLPDGNKRCAWASARIFLRLNGLDIDPSGPYADEAAEAVEQLAEGLIDEPGFARWLESRTVPLSGNLLVFVEESDAASYERAGADPQVRRAWAVMPMVGSSLEFFVDRRQAEERASTQDVGDVVAVDVYVRHR